MGDAAFDGNGSVGRTRRKLNGAFGSGRFLFVVARVYMAVGAARAAGRSHMYPRKKG